MTVLKKYDLTGKETGEVKIDEKLLGEPAHAQMIKDYIVAIRKNARQWSANTKGRAEIRSTKSKPHPQKGSGKARQGAISTPQYRGGGIVFGPKPKFKQHVRINKKERKAAVASILTDKIHQNGVMVLEMSKMTQPKTKSVYQFLKSINTDGKRVLFLGAKGEDHHVFIRSMRNIPKAEFMKTININGYDLLLAENIIVMDASVDEFLAILGS